MVPRFPTALAKELKKTRRMNKQKHTERKHRLCRPSVGLLLLYSVFIECQH